MLRVYVAAALGASTDAAAVADELARHHQVVSRWHWRVRVGVGLRDPKAHEERAAILTDNLSDLDSADVVVAVTHRGHPRCTFAEIGYALAKGIACVYVHDSGDGRCLIDSHPLVVRLDVRERSFSIELLLSAISMAIGTARQTLPAPDPFSEERLEPVGRAAMATVDENVGQVRTWQGSGER